MVQGEDREEEEADPPHDRCTLEEDILCLEDLWGHTAPSTPPKPSEELPGGEGLRHVDLSTALEFRHAMQRSLPTSVCAVCSCSIPSTQTIRTTLDDLSGLHLLDATLPPTAQLPRSGHTTYKHNGRTYCLQPLAIG
ncbi:hypothetical protein DUNSADRAFT_12631, partial [Dunaliella salina]